MAYGGEWYVWQTQSFANSMVSGSPAELAYQNPDDLALLQHDPITVTTWGLKPAAYMCDPSGSFQAVPLDTPGPRLAIATGYDPSGDPQSGFAIACNAGADTPYTDAVTFPDHGIGIIASADILGGSSEDTLLAPVFVDGQPFLACQTGKEGDVTSVALIDPETGDHVAAPVAATLTAISDGGGQAVVAVTSPNGRDVWTATPGTGAWTQSPLPPDAPALFGVSSQQSPLFAAANGDQLDTYKVG